MNEFQFKSGSSSVFANKDLLEDSHSHILICVAYTYYVSKGLSFKNKQTNKMYLPCSPKHSELSCLNLPSYYDGLKLSDGRSLPRAVSVRFLVSDSKTINTFKSSILAHGQAPKHRSLDRFQVWKPHAASVTAPLEPSRSSAAQHCTFEVIHFTQ